MKNRKLPTTYTELQMAHLVRAPRPATTTGVRDRAILAVLCCCGLRASELCHMQVSDLRVVESVIFVRQGKFGAQRYVPVSRKTIALVETYLAQYRADADQPLFRCLDGRALSRRHLHKIVTRYATDLGLRGTVHTLRHSAAVRWLNRGVNLQTVRLLLGHAHITSTALYLHLSLDAVIAEFRRCLETPVAAPSAA